MTPLNLLDSAVPSGGSGRALIWRELRWVERQPVLEAEPLTAAAGEQHPSGERIRIPLTPGAFLGLRLLADTAGEHLRYCAGYFTSGPPGENTNTPNTGAPTGCPVQKEHASAAVNNANDAPPATSSQPFTPRTCTPAH